jgi:hypothetical protein
MGIPTNPGQPEATFAETGQIKPPQIEWIKNNPKTTTHLPCPNSSWLQSFSYDSASLRLTVTTKEGASWQHAQVYPNQFAEMKLQPSLGTYYTRNIKGKHPTAHILKLPTPGNYPRSQTHEKTEDRFKNPLTERWLAGRSTKSKRYG